MYLFKGYIPETTFLAIQNINLLKKKHISFKKGVEDALRKIISDIGENVKAMREESN